MKLLLDENLPKQLKIDFPNHQVFTVADMGWTGIKNGQLLQLMIDNKFDAFLTFDKNLQYQQNFTKYSIAVFVLSAKINTYKELTFLSPKVLSFIDQDNLQNGPIIIS
ncbi:MAG: hypothetical protein RL596_2043 [Bacteroidota bacterium]|jgi:hypothetical protein